MKAEIIWWTCNDDNELTVFQRYKAENAEEKTYYSITRDTVREEDVMPLYEPDGIEKYLMAHATTGSSESGSWKEMKVAMNDDYIMKYIANVMSIMDEFDCTAEEAIPSVEMYIGIGGEL